MAIHSIRSLGQLGINEGFDRIARKSLWSLGHIGETQGIYQHMRRHEEWVEDTHVVEWEGETYEETTIDEGFNIETSLFDQTLVCVFIIGEHSFEKSRYAVLSTAIYTLKEIGKTAKVQKFDNKYVPIFLGRLGVMALKSGKEKLAISSIEALKAISLNIDKNLRNTVYQTASSLINIGRVALQNKFIEISSSAAQILVNLESNDKRTITNVNVLFNKSLEGIQEFKEMYLKIKVSYPK